MHKLLYLLCFTSIFVLKSQAQCPDTNQHHELSGNQVKAVISNGGDLFWDGGNGRFYVPVDSYPDEPRSTIYAAGLWMGGLDPAGNLKLAAQTYGYNESDYAPGPLKPGTGEPYEGDYCDLFDRIWVVEKTDILNHIADFADNGEIDNPIENIFSWPGNKNYWSFLYNEMPLPDNPNGWAPFHDVNGDGIYQPDLGEFPHPPHVISILHPEQITWAVFNDNKLHDQSEATPIQAEVQLTSWSFDCFANHVLNHTVFTSHKIINRATVPIDSFFVGLWADFDLGCNLDDYLGCSPENDGFLAYNSDNLDGESSAIDCAGIPTYGYNPPAQSVTFLNQKLDKFIWYASDPSCVGPPGNQYPPHQPPTYYRFLKGLWNDGAPIHHGGSGYTYENIDTTNWVFPDNPNDSLGWSMYTLQAPNGDRRALGSTYIGMLNPGEATRLDMAFTYHGYASLDFLGAANQAYIEMAEMQQMYDMQFNGWCEGLISGVEDLNPENVTIYPNPSSGQINIRSDKAEIQNLTVYNSLGQEVFQPYKVPSKTITLDISNLSKGAYILKYSIKDNQQVKKVILQ